MDRTVITVDGLAGTGKTSLSKELARRLGFVHLSTGMLYRAVGYLALTTQTSMEDEPAIADLLSKHTLALVCDDSDSARLLLDGKDVVDALYAPEVSEATSKTAQLAAVREALIEPQREAFPGRPLVAEGRDMGSVIFPDAQVKFFVSVPEEVKVERRLAQLIEAGHGKSENERNLLKEKMKIEIHERDVRDAERNLAPTLQTEDMEVVDNSSQPLEKVVQNMYNLVTARGIHPCQETVV
ncbi:MAG: (d)CMP kinase [Bdellovibrionales bacterium]|nr:(d)CMP kinase [Bdellovibrionales bacterium]